MTTNWLYSVDGEGVRVTPEFMDKLRSRNAAALRSLQKRDLTALLRKGFTRAPHRDDAYGFFWSDIPETELIPFIRGGRSSNRPWLPDSVFVTEKQVTERRWKAILRMVRLHRKHIRTPPTPKRRTRMEPEPWVGWNPPAPSHPEQELSVKIEKGGRSMTVTTLKPNPKFELVVVNRFDKAALLKLLDELDNTENVARWLAERTVRRGATTHTLLHSDYKAWCEQCGESAAGKKNFAQALIAAGVVKLTRSNTAQRYELEMRAT
jgi:hypothetical protein